MTEKNIVGSATIEASLQEIIGKVDFQLEQLNKIPSEISADIDYAEIFTKTTVSKITEHVESFLTRKIASQKEMDITRACIELKSMYINSEIAYYDVSNAYKKAKENNLTIKEMPLEIQNAFFRIKKGKKPAESEMSQVMQENILVAVTAMDMLEIIRLTNEAWLANAKVDIKGYKKVAFYSVIKFVLQGWFNPEKDSDFQINIRCKIPINLKEIPPELEAFINRDLRTYHEIKKAEIEKVASFLKEQIESENTPLP